jgi:hypothetical protein
LKKLDPVMRLSDFTRLHLRLGAAIAVPLATGLLLTHAGSVRPDAIQALAWSVADSLSLAQTLPHADKALIFTSPGLELHDLAQRF